MSGTCNSQVPMLSVMRHSPILLTHKSPCTSELSLSVCQSRSILRPALSPRCKQIIQADQVTANVRRLKVSAHTTQSPRHSSHALMHTKVPSAQQHQIALTALKTSDSVSGANIPGLLPDHRFTTQWKDMEKTHLACPMPHAHTAQ
jgi:hypothetical protein